MLNKLWLIPCVIAAFFFISNVGTIWKWRNRAKVTPTGDRSTFTSILRNAARGYAGAFLSLVCTIGFYWMSQS